MIKKIVVSSRSWNAFQDKNIIFFYARMRSSSFRITIVALPGGVLYLFILQKYFGLHPIILVYCIFTKHIVFIDFIQFDYIYIKHVLNTYLYVFQ